jgi:hypothetical protein
VDVASEPGRGTTVRFSVPCAAVASPRPYVARAVLWGVVAMVGLVMLSRVTLVRPIWLTVVLIAAIAVARYAVAAGPLGRAKRALRAARGAAVPASDEPGFGAEPRLK